VALLSPKKCWALNGEKGIKRKMRTEIRERPGHRRGKLMIFSRGLSKDGAMRSRPAEGLETGNITAAGNWCSIREMATRGLASQELRRRGETRRA